MVASCKNLVCISHVFGRMGGTASGESDPNGGGSLWLCSSSCGRRRNEQRKAGREGLGSSLRPFFSPRSRARACRRFASRSARDVAQLFPLLSSSSLHTNLRSIGIFQAQSTGSINRLGLPRNAQTTRSTNTDQYSKFAGAAKQSSPPKNQPLSQTPLIRDREIRADIHTREFDLIHT